ncbi:MAG: UDP-N-acetylglucosamine 1-carboxyvinyltransferase, partial [Oryzihumus sp.]
MECFEVTGGARLNGRVRVTGAKNRAIKLMASALLTPGRTTIDEVPDILDVSIMSEVLRRLGCGVTYERTEGGGGGGRVVIDVPE